ncbi:uncharacterized protein SCHCODRAFT_02477917, partial [Schizophyllum commune H4-8]|uniref:uncharacterized protein n=1 Tax=Schizophyllum commune (strain H4-8 / FGSC 9210) TaxID=578458 RepID=UPI00216063AD
VLVGLEESEVSAWRSAYASDTHFSKVLESMSCEESWYNPDYPQYHYSDNGLLYFEDWNGNNRLCVPNSLRAQVMNDVHNTISEGAHGG